MKYLRIFVKENTFLPRESILDFGWGNGYVVIPKGHKIHGMSYNDIHELIPMLDCNGGLTFSSSVDDLQDWCEITKEDDGCWVVGFDTCHSWDTLENMDMNNVKNITVKLKKQIEDFIKNK